MPKTEKIAGNIDNFSLNEVNVESLEKSEENYNECETKMEEKEEEDLVLEKKIILMIGAKKTMVIISQRQ